jgi:hypothetical protein
MMSDQPGHNLDGLDIDLARRIDGWGKRVSGENGAWGKRVRTIS